MGPSHSKCCEGLQVTFSEVNLLCAFSGPVRIQSPNFFFCMCQQLLFRRESFVELKSQSIKPLMSCRWWCCGSTLPCWCSPSCFSIGPAVCSADHVAIGVGNTQFSSRRELRWSSQNNWVLIELCKRGKAKRVLSWRMEVARAGVCNRLAVDETYFKHVNCKFHHNFPLTLAISLVAIFYKHLRIVVFLFKLHEDKIPLRASCFGAAFTKTFVVTAKRSPLERGERKNTLSLLFLSFFWKGGRDERWKMGKSSNSHAGRTLLEQSWSIFSVNLLSSYNVVLSSFPFFAENKDCSFLFKQAQHIKLWFSGV